MAKALKAVNSPPPAQLSERAGKTMDVKLDPKDFLPKVVRIPIKIRGITDLIVNNFSHKSREQMLSKQMQSGTATRKRAPKDPAANFEGSKYLDGKGRDCLHAGGIRNSIIQAARNLEGVTMASLKQAVLIEGPEGAGQILLPIEYESCTMREDVVRNESGVADIRHRASYQGWSCKFDLIVVENVVSVPQAYQLLSMAGFACGLHEWRPSGKSGLGGPYGRFEIATEQAAE